MSDVGREIAVDAMADTYSHRGLARLSLDQAGEIERLRRALRETIQLARDFNRGAMTWQEYDRKLATLEVAFDEDTT